MSKDRYEKCTYPGCQGNIVPGKTIDGLCIKHTDLLQFFAWCLENIKIKQDNVTKSGLILPK